MTRGEIWWCDFGVPFGSEVGFLRPVIIIQNDILNESNLMTSVVVPITSNLAYAEFENNVYLDRKETKLSKDSVAQSHLIIHVDKRRLKNKVSKLSRLKVEKIIECLNKVVSGES